MMVMKSLESKGLVKSHFNWQWFYYFLNDEGIAALREDFHLPATVFPATLTKQSRPQRSGDPATSYGDGERKGKGKGKGGKGKGRGKGGWSHGKDGDSYGEDKQWSSNQAATEEAAPSAEAAAPAEE